jgi:D-alanine transfer protein
MPHLFAGPIALSLAAIVLFTEVRVLIHFEHATIVSTAPENFSLKNQGLAFQSAAAHARNVLPIYGSSELRVPAVPEKGNNFFRTAPTGFQLSPVGTGGADPLIMLQKVGALGSHLHDKRIAISLSPGWFFKSNPGWQGYRGNFSPMAASEMVFGTALDFGLKREIASRMLECPSTFEERPLLEFELNRLASDRWVDHIAFCALWPAGKLQTGVMELEDHLLALYYIRHHLKPAPRLHSEALDWPQLIAKASRVRPVNVGKPLKIPPLARQIAPGSRDMAFRSGVNSSPAWTDLELLLRALTEVHARPLILSMPISGTFYDHAGVSHNAREIYYIKLRALEQRYHVMAADFEDHDEDPAFLIRYQSHLTAKGWVYYDRALDDFFHGRLPRS